MKIKVVKGQSHKATPFTLGDVLVTHQIILHAPKFEENSEAMRGVESTNTSISLFIPIKQPSHSQVFTQPFRWLMVVVHYLWFHF
jgi:hypothetical protein